MYKCMRYIDMVLAGRPYCNNKTIIKKVIYNIEGTMYFVILKCSNKLTKQGDQQTLTKQKAALMD